MIVQTVTFAVPGRPLPQGSKIARRRGSHVVLVDQSDCKTNDRPSDALKKWRARVQAKAREAYCGPPWRGAVSLSAVFVLPLPRSYLLKGGRIAKGKSLVPTGKPDLDKLVRAVKDACSDVIYKDDAQVVGYRPPFCKRWAKPGGVGGVYLELDLLEPERPGWEPS